MPLARAVIVATLAGLVVPGCSGSGAPERSAVQPSVSTPIVEHRLNDGIETVRNIAGSRWGADAALEEQLAIGEEVGTEAYLFGTIIAAWATDERIYLIDAQIPAVRAFDLDGRHLLDVGGAGQGPGEYLMPTALAITESGRVAVADAMQSRINLYDAQGVLLEDWPIRLQKSALGLTLSYDGQLFTRSWSNDEGRLGVQAVGPEGLLGDIVFPPDIAFTAPTVSVGKGLQMMVPFAPSYSWAYTPGGEMIAGVGDAYRFEIHRPDGRAMVVERTWEPVEVSADEAAFRVRVAADSMRLINPGGAIDRGDIMPHKPAFNGFYPDRAGRVWVVRPGPGRSLSDCAEAERAVVPRLIMPTVAGAGFEVAGKSGGGGRTDSRELDGGCWTDSLLFDVFDLRSGELLGTLEAPEAGFRAPLFADSDRVLAAVADDLGTVRLKLYRLRTGSP